MTPVPTTILIAALLAAPACGEENSMRPSIQEVKRRHAAELMAIEGVVSVGIGRDPDGQAVIVVGLDHERKQARPLPTDLDGYPVRTKIVGEIRTR